MIFINPNTIDRKEICEKSFGLSTEKENIFCVSRTVSQLSNGERKNIQAFSNATIIHNLASICKIHLRTIKRTVNKY